MARVFYKIDYRATFQNFEIGDLLHVPGNVESLRVMARLYSAEVGHTLRIINSDDAGAEVVRMA